MSDLNASLEKLDLSQERLHLMMDACKGLQNDRLRSFIDQGGIGKVMERMAGGATADAASVNERAAREIVREIKQRSEGIILAPSDWMVSVVAAILDRHYPAPASPEPQPTLDERMKSIDKALEGTGFGPLKPLFSTKLQPRPAPTSPGWYECRQTWNHQECREVLWFDGTGMKDSPWFTCGQKLSNYTDFIPLVPASPLPSPPPDSPPWYMADEVRVWLLTERPELEEHTDFITQHLQLAFEKGKQLAPDVDGTRLRSYLEELAVDRYDRVSPGVKDEIRKLLKEFRVPAPGYAELRAAAEAYVGLLREVYQQAGNGAPANRRHALTAGLRDRIRDVIYDPASGEPRKDET